MGCLRQGELLLEAPLILLQFYSVPTQSDHTKCLNMNQVNPSKKKILDAQPGIQILIFRKANSPSTLKTNLLMSQQNSLLKPGVQHFLVLKDESSQSFMNFPICTFRACKHLCCLAFKPPQFAHYDDKHSFPGRLY